jgi:hypothetical protein
VGAGDERSFSRSAAGLACEPDLDQITGGPQVVDVPVRAATDPTLVFDPSRQTARPEGAADVTAGYRGGRITARSTRVAMANTAAIAIGNENALSVTNHKRITAANPVLTMPTHVQTRALLESFGGILRGWFDSGVAAMVSTCVFNTLACW